MNQSTGRKSTENAAAREGAVAVCSREGRTDATVAIAGRYHVQCHNAAGELQWEDTADNLVTVPGKNLALDTYLAGAGYTVTGPFIGLADANVAAAVNTDTLASKTTWKEIGVANAPTYTGPRKTVTTWGAAAGGSKVNSTVLTFAITGPGSVGGCFLVLGAGATSAIDGTVGTLYSVGAFTGGTKVVQSGDALTVTYTATLT